MFRIQNWKQALGFMTLGSVFTIIGMLMSPVTAQRDKFGEIECTSLTVVDSEGNARAVIKNVDDFFGGGVVELNNADGIKTVELYAGMNSGGYVRVWSKHEGERGPGAVQLETDTNGGRLDIFGKEGAALKRDRTPLDDLFPNIRGETCVSVRVDSNGAGVVSVSEGKTNGKRAHLMVDRIGIWGKGVGQQRGGSALLWVNANGGRLDVYGINNQQTRASVQVNAHGNGAVSTWKKDGEKFHTLGEVTRVPHSITTIADVIESKIDGDFEGWDGETVVKLMNGQIWQQTQYHYEYHYAFMPDVIIYKSGGRYKMLVDGTDEAVVVERLK